MLAAPGIAPGLPTVRAASPEAILGTWLTDDGASKVEVSAAKAADGTTVYARKISAPSHTRRERPGAYQCAAAPQIP